MQRSGAIDSLSDPGSDTPDRSSVCSCGNILPMHDRILGRSDDMIIFRAVNIYPGQIDQVLSTIPDASCEYQVHLDRKEDGKDYMIIRLECGEELRSIP